MVKILREYFPQLLTKLPISGKVLPPPNWLLETIETGVHLRNDIVHGRSVTLKASTVRETLSAVNDLLYYCDLVAGQYWAAARLSHRFQLELKPKA